MNEAISSLLSRHGLQAKKSWGQNFLVDHRAYAAIVDAASAGPGSSVVEIGAGLGTLTRRLAAKAGRVIAIERDRDLVPILRDELSAFSNVEIVEANALTFDYQAAALQSGGKLIAVGNLPYQIASQLIFKLLDAKSHLERMVVMLQREMADRLAALPGTKIYGALTVMVQVVGRVELVHRVAPGSFFPVPKVASAVVRITPRAPADGPGEVRAAELPWLRTVVQASFGQRRKTLRNGLRRLAGASEIERVLDQVAIDGGVRGETLAPGEFVKLSRALAPYAEDHA